MTATAFMSVSLDPPLVLVSLREGSRMDDLLTEQPLWAVSVLADGQLQVAGRFAMKNRISDRLLFEGLPAVRGRSAGRRCCRGRWPRWSAARSPASRRATTPWSSGASSAPPCRTRTHRR